jgi:hypothetical protein
VQNRNFVLAEGFQHSAAKSNALSLCLRYAAQAERQGGALWATGAGRIRPSEAPAPGPRWRGPPGLRSSRTPP